jgi:septin family protein
LDLQVIRTLQGKTTVVPIISKADTLTTAHMTFLKKTVWESLKKANLDPLEALGLDDVDVSSDSNRSSRIEEKDEDGEEQEDRQQQDEEEEEEEDGTQAAPKSLDDVRLPSSSGSAQVKRSSTGSLRHQRSHSTDSGNEIPFLPLSIISPDTYEPGLIGRKFPWGFADPNNLDHCDFLRLKDAVFSEWRGELRESSRELWYEGWRTSRLKNRGDRKV